MKKIFINPWLYIFLYAIASLVMMGWLIKKPVKVVIKTFIFKTNANIERGHGQRFPSFKKDKIFQNESDTIKKKT